MTLGHSAPALHDAEEAVRLYPGNFFGWDVMFRYKKDSLGGFNSQLSRNIDSVLTIFLPKATEHIAPRFAWWFLACGHMDKAKTFDDAWIAAHPDSSNYTVLVRFEQGAYG